MGGASSDAIELLSYDPPQTLDGITISDQHFSGIDGYAISLFGATNVIIERCTFDNVGAAIRVDNCTNVIVRDCAAWNIQGPSGDFVNMGVFVQAISCDAVTVEDCWVVNVPSESGPEDVLSMFQSTDVTFQRNRIWGHGPSTTASSINLGDGGGCEYGQAIGNVVVQAFNTGIAVSGGDFMTVANNIVYTQRGRGGFGTGVTVWNFDGGSCSAIELTGNRMLWDGIGGIAEDYVNVDDGCGTVVDTDNVWNDPTVTEADWTPTGYYGWEA